MARPFTKFPIGARAHLERMAEHGMLSEVRAADALGMPLEQFKDVIANHAASRKVWEDAFSIERDMLLNALYDRAVNGDTQAAKTLLAVRHGLSEKDPSGHGGGVTLNFNLPAAMSAKDYLEAITVERVGEAEGSDGEHRILVRSPEIRAGQRIITTQLPRAISGLLVEPA